jgi:hypothetical protein
MMRRIMMLLAVAAVMVAMMAATVSPAFATQQRLTPGDPNGTSNGEGFGSDYGCIQHGGNHINCGWHAGKTK